MVNEFPVRNVRTGKTELPFQNFRLSREFYSGANQKNVYYMHLHPKRNFREFVVNGKQPMFPKMSRCGDLIESICISAEDMK